MSNEPPLQLLTIDLDDTVWPCMPVIQAAEQALYAWLEQHVPRLTAVYDRDSLHAHRKALQRRMPGIAHDISAVRLASLRQLFNTFGYDPALAEQAFGVFIRIRNRVRPYRDVAPVLESLASEFCLISVTNGNAEVACTPLASQFHHSLNAAGAGAMKPDPAMFEQALALAGARGEQSLHIGDDPYLDVEAARRAGLRAVWMNREGRPWPEALPRPEAEFQDFLALYQWLGRACAY